jgi:hypothetical protein
LRTAERRDQASTPNTVVVGVGTAGSRRALLFLQRMAELSAVNRIQSAVFYDCNETTISHIGKFLAQFLGRSRRGSGIQVIFPSYVPLSNGFSRDPTLFHEYRGPLERDMDNVVGQVMDQSERAGRAPAVIMEFMGFAGHSVLGAHLHGKLGGAFPSSVILPVLMLPTDHVCEEWTRRYIWEQYEHLLQGSNCLVTTQSSSVSGEDDLRLATGLAGVEMADFEEEETSGSPLARACRRLIPASSGWLGMGIVKRSMPVTNRFQWLRFPPRWQQYAAIGPEDDTYMSLGHAIWSTFDPSAQMAAGVNTSPNAPQEVVVSLPIHPDALEPMALEAAEVLDRSGIFAKHPNIDIAFNTARFTEGLKKDPYMHVTRIYPVQGDLEPVLDILHPDREPDEGRRRVVAETGFGSYYHLDQPNPPAPLTPGEHPERSASTLYI